MCQFFSAIVDDEGKVLWKNGITSHSELEQELKIRDSSHYAKVELFPTGKSRFNKVETWKFTIDEARKPDWWDGAYEDNVRQVIREWMKSGTKYVWNGHLDLRGITSAQGLTLPQIIGGWLYLSSLASAQGLTLPQSIGGSLDLSSLASAQGLTLPQSIGETLYLNPNIKHLNTIPQRYKNKIKLI